ncbi:DUF1810 domain-containing protein [Flavobacterium sp. '19STA2R22 D10 B1']|uniref:DUF1810 domain-containing protein n=1 Tax=Flavobacterium aerium TaxID=3037261 RepID=UPI00278BBCEF|nr:DUF1810 domain-containing protein [Flavobacterium sp. '19STA2R22 D10 B1']
MDSNKLTRFLEAQNQVYLKALLEIKKGHKETHWMWFVFPQIKGLDFSESSNFYGIEDLEEAKQYLSHPVLGKHLIEISTVLLQLKGKTALQIFGQSDYMKLRSCMTLFAGITISNPIFEQVIEKYFDGLQDEYTLQLLLKNKFSNDTV